MIHYVPEARHKICDISTRSSCSSSQFLFQIFSIHLANKLIHKFLVEFSPCFDFLPGCPKPTTSSFRQDTKGRDHKILRLTCNHRSCTKTTRDCHRRHLWKIGIMSGELQYAWDCGLSCYPIDLLTSPSAYELIYVIRHGGIACVLPFSTMISLRELPMSIVTIVLTTDLATTLPTRGRILIVRWHFGFDLAFWFLPNHLTRKFVLVEPAVTVAKNWQPPID